MGSAFERDDSHVLSNGRNAVAEAGEVGGGLLRGHGEYVDVCAEWGIGWGYAVIFVIGVSDISD